MTIDFDRRAVHRVVSDPTVYDMALDCDAIAQKGADDATRVHWIALGYGDPALVEYINRMGAAFHSISELIHKGLDLYAESYPVDPYRAVELASAEAA